MAEVPKKLVIIDGKSVFYRGYFAMPNLATKDGTPTGGVFGFAVMALEVLKRLKPDYVCVAWDKPKTNIRKRLELYPEYKAGRKPPPPDFYDQIPILHELLDAFGWPLYELDDYEADDIMGTLAVQAREKGIDTMLVTSDLDLLQVINGNVHVYALKKGLSNIELYHPESFKEKYGIEVDQFLDLKSLKGDSSDNIPGVPGVGEKTAAKLLNEYRTLDGVYENVDLITPETLASKLRAGKDSAYLSKKLAAIWTDAPIKLNLKEVDGSKCRPEDVQHILQKLEFRSLVRQLPEVMKVPEEDIQSINTSNLKLPKLVQIKSLNEIKDLGKEIIIHSYAAGQHGRDPKYILISPNPENVYVIDARNVLGKTEAIEASEIKKIGYDVKSTIEVLKELGAENFAGLEHDVLIASFLLDSLRREQSLTELARRDLNYEGAELDNMPPEEFVERAPVISAVIRGLYELQSVELAKNKKLASLAKDIEWPVIPVLADMEYIGIKLDSDYLNKFAEELKDQISDYEQQIYGYADEEFNIASPGQLSEILFTKLKLSTQGIKKGKTAYSTAASELDKLRGSHPIVDLITQYREVTKLMNTYVEPLPNQVDENGRLHTTYNMTVAPTGRLSSEKPNLQNIPVRSELGREIRTAFVAGKGKLLISADYSQIELRIAALLSDDKNMIDMFNQDVDIHTATAAQVYGREPEDVTKNMRRDAKVINFGILYGMSPHGLSAATGMTFTAAKEFIDKYFEIRKPVLEYLNKLREQAKDEGYVETLFGRRRPTPDVKSSNFMVRQAAERAAINMPIQGTAADIMKLAMIKLQKELDKHKDAHMLLQIHDSVLVECPESEADELAHKIKEVMEGVYKLPIKLTVDTSIGKNWGDL